MQVCAASLGCSCARQVTVGSRYTDTSAIQRQMADGWATATRGVQMVHLLFSAVGHCRLAYPDTLLVVVAPAAEVTAHASV